MSALWAVLTDRLISEFAFPIETYHLLLKQMCLAFGNFEIGENLVFHLVNLFFKLLFHH